MSRGERKAMIAESMDHLEDVVGTFFREADDDTPARLKRQFSAAR